MEYVCGPAWDRRLFDITPKGNIGIMITGGLDSWVLYNLLVSTGSDITLFNVHRKDGFDNPDRVTLLTGKEVVKIEDKSQHSGERVARGVDTILAEYPIDQLYIAINRDPPVEHFPQFTMEGRPFRPWRIYHPRICAPFLQLYKYHIIDLATSLNIDVGLTLSCIANNSDPCGDCWQCLERRWGYEQLNKP